MKRIGLILALVLGLAGVLEAAEPPDSMNYQGVLRDYMDAPIDGTTGMVFRFYDVSTGGTALLEETHGAVEVDSGLFNVRLGTGSMTPAMSYDSLANLFANESELYLAVKVGSDGEMTPRIPLNAAGYALNADLLDGNHESAFARTVHVHQGSEITGTVGDADTVDGKHASEFVDLSSTAQTKTGTLTLTKSEVSHSATVDLMLEHPLGDYTAADLSCESVVYSPGGTPYESRTAASLLDCPGGNAATLTSYAEDVSNNIRWYEATAKLAPSSFVGEEVFDGDPVGRVTVDLASPGESTRSGYTSFGGRFELNRNQCSGGYCTITDEACDVVTDCPEPEAIAKLALKEDGENYGIRATGIDYAGYFDGRVKSFTEGEFEPEELTSAQSFVDLTGDYSRGGLAVCNYSRIGGEFGPDYEAGVSVELATCSGGAIGARISAEESPPGFPDDTWEATADLANPTLGLGGSFVSRLEFEGTETSRATVDLANVNDGVGVSAVAAVTGGTFTGASYGVQGIAAETGVWGKGAQAGGFFRDADPMQAFAWLGFTSGSDKYGIYARAPVDAGYFEGNVTVSEDMTVQDEMTVQNSMTVINGLQFGNNTNDSHVFWGSLKSGSASDEHKILPAAGNWGLVGDATNYWYSFYGTYYYAKATALIAFDKYPDLDLLDAMEMVDYTEPKSGKEMQIFAPDSLPPMLKGDPAVDGPGADQFIDLSKAVGFAFGSLRQMRQEVRDQGLVAQKEIDQRTADPATGAQTMEGNFQVILDQGADERSRFSVFGNGRRGLSEELLRVDEDGNLYLKGALRPASLDLAEYHPVTEPVHAGDVLVVDRDRPGNMRRARVAADPAVVGIVSGNPGILLGSGISRIASADHELAAELELARSVGNSADEARLWVELEEKFGRTHAPLALSGTVPCKVDAGYGAIRPGDLLTTSPTAGHAMRADEPQPGTILGKALEPLEAGTGMIKVLVMLR